MDVDDLKYFSPEELGDDLKRAVESAVRHG